MPYSRGVNTVRELIAVVKSPRKFVAKWLPAAAIDVGFVSLGLLAPWVFGSRCWRRQARWRYQRLAPHYDREVVARTPAYSAALETALSRLSPPFERILDVSTGTGAVALAAARRFPDAVMCACDLSTEMLRVAQQNAAASGVHVAWQQTDGARLPYHDAGFDLVFLQNAPPAFAELARVVKPRGTVVLCYTKGGALPGALERLLVRRLARLGIPVVELGRVEGGLYVIARRRDPEPPGIEGGTA